jgi:hypothetical protein
LNVLDLVRSAISQVVSATLSEDGIRVTTHCMYPSNGFVQVMVRGGPTEFEVSDEGMGLREIESAGAEVRSPDGLLRHLVAPLGLRITNGIVRSPRVSAEVLPVMIPIVANASKEIAEWLFVHCKIKRERNFKKIVRDFLRRTFDDKVKDQVIVGESQKAHKFENIVLFPDGHRLIVDAVIHDVSSINARVVANADVKMAKYASLEQRIVYDDAEEWGTEELNLLQIGAIPVPFSKAHVVIPSLAR